MHHILMNANYALLKYSLNAYPEYNSDLPRQAFDQNPMTHLALSLVGYKKYRSKCLQSVQEIIDSQHLQNSININQ